ncbi:response regulator transcription factor [Catenulispora subtropica]|uniref:Response regulator transcription factor n=1 Tax=Catenulispora subtropica TaxID=450798 RepID=A0ABN2R921_9ACTN
METVPEEPIRVLIAEDMQLLREAIVGLLSLEPGIVVVAEAADGPSALARAQQHRPDVAVVDVAMPGSDGIDVAAVLREQLPRCRVLILTALSGPGMVRKALRAGVAGFLPKDVGATQLADAVRTVAAGGRVLPPELAVAAVEATLSPLTQRETEVLRLAATGAGPAEIATKLFITYGTARNHLTAAVAKLNARNRIDAVRIATEQGWL